MSIIRPGQLESIQEYARQGNYGFQRMEPVEVDDDTICPNCGNEKAWDEELCWDCQQEEKEEEDE